MGALTIQVHIKVVEEAGGVDQKGPGGELDDDVGLPNDEPGLAS